jgi:2-succinyl-5-enolpyruvyl-6-hydroxy-3-cyclohexene-1-carboxylate synthase
VSRAEGLRAFVEALVAAGVRDAVVCPGSRSTPLALALRSAAGLRVRVLYDERAAGFFAIGMARTTGRPVVLVATSGTATVEFAPAVVEAQLSRVPLVLLTSDRPIELRDRGAPQAIDQTHLFSRAAKWFAELPLQDDDPVTDAHWRWVAGRAVAVAADGPAGPVQVNVPFREPLLPDGSLASGGPGLPAHEPYAVTTRGRRTLDPDDLRALADRIAGARRGLILAGPDDDPALPGALASLAEATGFPIVADPLSGLRAGRHDRARVIVRGDQLARTGPWIEAHAPDLVIRTGAMPTSKPLTELMSRLRPPLLVLDGDAGWRESSFVPATYVHADAAGTSLALAGVLAGRGTPPAEAGWADAWLTADRAATAAMDAWLAALDEPFEGAPYPVLADALPDGAVLWAGNSMPVRDLDAWLPSTGRAIAVRSNRGANGIDGVVSTALGSAAANAEPVALVVGDVSFLHDLNALVAARLHGLSATIVLVNNDGGGIFSFLPQARVGEAAIPGSGLPEHYEELFGTPHGVDLAPIVTALGAEHRLVTHAELDAAIRDSVARPGVQVVELRTDRTRNVELHREVAAVVQRALGALHR